MKDKNKDYNDLNLLKLICELEYRMREDEEAEDILKEILSTKNDYISFCEKIREYLIADDIKLQEEKEFNIELEKKEKRETVVFKRELTLDNITVYEASPN